MQEAVNNSLCWICSQLKEGGCTGVELSRYACLLTRLQCWWHLTYLTSPQILWSFIDLHWPPVAFILLVILKACSFRKLWKTVKDKQHLVWCRWMWNEWLLKRLTGDSFEKFDEVFVSRKVFCHENCGGYRLFFIFILMKDEKKVNL